MNEEKKRLNIALLTALTLQDKRSSWRITNEYMKRALQKYCGEVVDIGPIRLREVFVGKILNKLSQLILKKRFLYYHSFYLARKYARIAGQRLATQHVDVIIAPSSATEIAFLKTDTPIILIEGITFVLLHNYYPQFSNLLPRSEYETNRLQELALKKASLIIDASHWAARSVINDYHIEEKKVRVLPYGANLNKTPSMTFIQEKKKSEHCKLLFVGTDWQRKGGDIAFATLVKLEEMSIQAELVVCGCVPPEQFSHKRMTVIPFLDQKVAEQREQFEQLFMNSDFFFLPTRNEAFGIVFSEACAFGLPIITTNTGGVSGAVRDGENGFMLPLSAGGTEYAEVIAKVYQDDQRYIEMVRASRTAFDQILSWDAWGIAMSQLINELLENKNKEEALACTSAKETN